MVVRVLVVDDSRFFRRRVTEMLESDLQIKVIGSAENGSEAVQKSARLKPDVITMDIEMPVMDGITATKRILATQRIPILMFSSLTTEGAKATFDALEAGAVDYLPKRFEDISQDKNEAKRQLCDRVKSVAVGYVHHTTSSSTNISGRDSHQPSIQKQRTHTDVSQRAPPTHTPAAKSTQIKHVNYNLVLIGTSTGGPIALQKVLTALPGDFPSPLLVIQHMPGSFTGAFAQRLNQISKIEIREAQTGDELKPGLALLAPGGKQMELVKLGAKTQVKITTASENQNYKPCIDLTFKSVANVVHGKVLAIVLTGMGADGCEGARILKRKGAAIWAQDKDSCVVYGMPAAVAEAGLADHVLSLGDIGKHLAQRT